jgi:hypothetical protein
VITFSFTGSVTAVPVDEVGSGVDFGTAIQGSYTFESAASDLVAAGTSASNLSRGRKRHGPVE